MREERSTPTKRDFLLKRDLLYSENPVDVVKELEKYKHSLKWRAVEYESFEPSENAIISLKIDGELNALYFRDGKASFFSRTGRERTGLPVTDEVEKLLSARGIESLLCFGELYVVDESEKPVPYPKALSLLRTLRPEEELDRIRFIVFDIHSVNGERVEGDYWERFLTIQDIFGEGKLVKPAATVVGSRKEMDDFWKRVKKGLAEGIVVREDSLYKIKPSLTVDLAVIGVEISKEHPDMMGALVLAFLDDDGVFRYAGKVGTGFSDKDRKEWLEYAKQNKLRQEGRIIYVKPTRVVEIETTHGFNVREAPAFSGKELKPVEDRVSAVPRVPVFVRVREDKKVIPTDLRLEQVPVFSATSGLILGRGVATLYGGHLFVRSDQLKRAKLDVPCDVLHIVSFTPGFYPTIAVHSPREDGEAWGWIEPGGYHWIGTLYPPKSFMIFENIPDQSFVPVLVRCPRHGLVLKKVDAGYRCPKGELYSDEDIARELWPRTIWSVAEQDIPAWSLTTDPGLFLKVRPYQYARAPLEKIFKLAKLKPGTEREVVVESPYGRLTKKDVYEYYKSVFPLMSKWILNNELMVFIKTDDVIIRRHPPGGDSIVVEDEADFDELNTGRTVEFHLVVGEKTKLAWVDVDPGRDFPFTETKKITRALLDRLKKFGKTSAKFSGRRGFHILIELSQARDVDELRHELERELQSYIQEANLKNVTTKPRKSERECRLDVSTLHELGSVKAPYSLDARTGLVSVPVDNVESFEIEQAKPSVVSKSSALRLRRCRPRVRPKRVTQDALMLVWEKHPWLGLEPRFVQIGGGGFWFRDWPEDSSLVYPETRAPATIDTLVQPTRTPWLTQPSPAINLIVSGSLDKEAQKGKLLEFGTVELRYDVDTESWKALIPVGGRTIEVRLKVGEGGVVDKELFKRELETVFPDAKTWTESDVDRAYAYVQEQVRLYYGALQELQRQAGSQLRLGAFDSLLKRKGIERSEFFESIFGVLSPEKVGAKIVLGDVTVYLVKVGYTIYVVQDESSFLTLYYSKITPVLRVSTTVYRETAALEVEVDLFGRVKFYVYKPRKDLPPRVETAGGERLEDFARRRGIPEEAVAGLMAFLLESYGLYVESLAKGTEGYAKLRGQLTGVLNARTVAEIAERVKYFRPIKEVALELQPLLGDVATVLLNYIAAYPDLVVDLTEFVAGVDKQKVVIVGGVPYRLRAFYAVKDMYEKNVIFKLERGEMLGEPEGTEFRLRVQEILSRKGKEAFDGLEELAGELNTSLEEVGKRLNQLGYSATTLFTQYELLPSELLELGIGTEELKSVPLADVFRVLKSRLGAISDTTVGTFIDELKRTQRLSELLSVLQENRLEEIGITRPEERAVLVTVLTHGTRSSLEEYIRKRDLRTSGEPVPKTLEKQPSRGYGIIAVQMHKAHRAGEHYDLRIEDEGVLKSWVVRHFPQFVSGEKDRVFAIQVEDHPIEYVTEMPEKFEIKSGYGAGWVVLFDRGVYKTVKKEPKKWVFEVDMKNAKETWYLFNIDKDKWILGRKKV